MQTHIDYDGLNSLFLKAVTAHRNSLYEHEVYEFVRLLGGETPPRVTFLPKGTRFDESLIHGLPGDKVVVKVVSPHILHKSDIGGVRICKRESGSVLSTIRRMSCEIPEEISRRIDQGAFQAVSNWAQLTDKKRLQAIEADIHGFLICQYMHPDSEQFGGELLIGLRNSREFGMIFTAGLGGRDTELYAKRFRKGQAVVSASVEMVDGDRFFQLFQQTISYKKLAGLTRGQQRIVTDNQLLECFTAFIEVGKYFSAIGNKSEFLLDELEINPFAFSDFLMMPLDGLCKFSPKTSLPVPRPIDAIEQMVHPATIGIVGCSATKSNIGRIILQNIINNGFARDKITVFHPSAQTIDSITATAKINDLQYKLDLLILAVSGDAVPELINTIIDKNLAATVVLVSGSLGEKNDEVELTANLRNTIAKARIRGEDVPVFLGANSLGILSQPGKYDSMFIPESKLPKIRGPHKRSVALVSQSGAYLITRMSRLSFLDPAYGISVGNQVDLSVGDFLHFFNSQDDLATLGFYVEGFNDLDGLNSLRGIHQARKNGREVIFYKAGRTPEGKDALSGHTASIAGDYAVCESCIAQAGAIVATTFSEFEGLLQLSFRLHSHTIRGRRLAAVSNAGYEAVGIADNILGEDFKLQMADFTAGTRTYLDTLFEKSGLANLTNVSNPLDITPMAGETTYVNVIEALLMDENVDAVIAAIVPLTPMLQTLPDELHHNEDRKAPSGIIKKIGKVYRAHSKPVVIVVDSGPLFDAMASNFQKEGLPVFRSADLAVSVLGRYLHHRLRDETSVE